MTWIAFTVSLSTVVLIAAIMVLMPAVTPRTVPLGVSVPAAHVDEPVVRSAVRRYRLGVAAAFVLSVILAAALAFTAPVAATIVPTFAMLLLAAAAYVVARRGIRQAKQSEGWYDDVAVRLSADVTPTATPRASVQPAWYLVSLVLLAATAAVGVSVYPRLPNPIPVHWDGAGHINGYADKSIWSVFGTLMIGAALIALLFGLAFLVRAMPQRMNGGGEPQTRALRARVQVHLGMSLLGQLAVLVVAILCATTLLSWLAPGNSTAMTAALITLIALMVVVLLVFMFRYSREVKVRPDHPTKQPDAAGAVSTPRTSALRTSSDAPDDDRFWKLGFFYVNRNDPATMVPKRFGVGWTVNLGSPGGMAAGILIALVIVAAIVVGIVVPTHHLG
jgi:uncharacterized membrane protein